MPRYIWTIFFLNLILVCIFLAALYIFYRHGMEIKLRRLEIALLCWTFILGVAFIASVKLRAPWYSDSYYVTYAAQSRRRRLFGDGKLLCAIPVPAGLCALFRNILPRGGIAYPRASRGLLLPCIAGREPAVAAAVLSRTHTHFPVHLLKHAHTEAHGAAAVLLLPGGTELHFPLRQHSRFQLRDGRGMDVSRLSTESGSSTRSCSPRR